MAQEPAASGASVEPARWPDEGGRHVVFLVDASSGLERRLIERWIESARPAGVEPADYELIPIPASRRRRRALDPRLDATLAAGGEVVLAPLRVAWRAPRRDGVHAVRPRDLLTLGDPRDPGWLRQRLVVRNPERWRVIVGEPAPASDLRRRWRERGGSDDAATTGLAEFVARQAALALERSERKWRGARYKVPRLVHEGILGRASFRGELARLAREKGVSEAKAVKDASRYLREIAATHSPLVIDLVASLIRWMYTQGYSERLEYDREKLSGISRLAQRHPVVFLPTHKSNLDHLVLQYALHENGLPPNHTAGGINMNFFPLGQLVRRSGVFFIRRSFRDNTIYKLVLRSYVDYLIEKRFSLEWYIEGGRSRSGKLLPPRFGLLAYVVDAFRRARSDDVYLIPVSIAYDQIQDVGSYADEQRGGAKQKESFGWFVGVIRNLRRRYGQIHIRFGDPLSLSDQLGAQEAGATPNPDDVNLELQKLAFEVSVRINRVTPITPISLLALALLGTGDRALTIGETRVALTNLLHYVRRRKLPTTMELEHLETDEGVKSTLEALVENGVVSCFDEGPEPVYVIGPERQLAAAYYRNTVVHFFINLAIVELSLLHASESPDDHTAAEFWEESRRLRDLLKFEFFFAEKDTFRAELRDELAFQDLDWEERLDSGPTEAGELVRGIRPFISHRVLRPFLESYQVVSDNLARWDPDVVVDRGEFLDQCLALGQQYRLQRRIRSSASVSKVLFENGLRLAENRGLLDVDRGDLVQARQSFAEEVLDALRRVDAVEALAASRRAGVIP